MIDENLAYTKLKFSIYPNLGVPINTKIINEMLSLCYQFKRQDLMNQGDKIFNLTYSINYALSNSHHSIEFKNNDYMHIPELFDEVIRYYKPRKNQVERLPEEWKNGIEIGYYEENILKPPLIIMRDILKKN